MFVQVIRGRTSDPTGVRSRFDAWRDELLPGAPGFLGSTGGVTTDGDVVAVARFADEDAARGNAQRSEQETWWRATEPLLEGPAAFRESTDVDVLMGGGSDDARFVQVMEGRIRDLAELRNLEPTVESFLRQHRPDLIGRIRAVHRDGTFTEVAYFSSKAAAREGEGLAIPEEMAESFSAYDALVDVDRWLDLGDPVLHSP